MCLKPKHTLLLYVRLRPRRLHNCHGVWKRGAVRLEGAGRGRDRTTRLLLSFSWPCSRRLLFSAGKSEVQAFEVCEIQGRRGGQSTLVRPPWGQSKLIIFISVRSADLLAGYPGHGWTRGVLCHARPCEHSTADMHWCSTAAVSDLPVGQYWKPYIRERLHCSGYTSCKLEQLSGSWVVLSNVNLSSLLFMCKYSFGGASHVSSCNGYFESVIRLPVTMHTLSPCGWCTKLMQYVSMHTIQFIC